MKLNASYIQTYQIYYSYHQALQQVNHIARQLTAGHNGVARNETEITASKSTSNSKEIGIPYSRCGTHVLVQEAAKGN